METWKNTRKFGENAPEINIPSTGSDWELYSSSMGCSVAARALTGAMKRALRKFDTLVGKKDATTAAQVGIKVFNDTCCKYAEYGANDTEPRANARHTMVQYAKARGFYIDSWDLW